MVQELKNKSSSSPIIPLPLAYSAILATPIGKLGIKVNQQHLWAIDFLTGTFATQLASDPCTAEVIRQLEYYFKDPHHQFKLPLFLQGTNFQKNVWQTLIQIPCGSTISYGRLAKQLKSGPRAIGNACRANPIPIIIPCHRIIAIQGIGGYAGNKQGSTIKRWLLNHEKAMTC